MGLLFVALVAILILGYLGFVPGVSTLFGSNKPRDLGVIYTQADLTSANKKTGVKLVALSPSTPDSQSLQYSGLTKIKASFTDEELTAMIANGKWKFYPVTNVQLEINDNGSVEVSGILCLDRIYKFATAMGIPTKDVDEVMNKIKFITNNPAFYLKGTISVTNNVFKIHITQAELGRFTIPTSWYDKYQEQMNTFASERVKFVPGFGIRSAKFENGVLKLDIDYPAVESTVNL